MTSQWKTAAISAIVPRMLSGIHGFTTRRTSRYTKPISSAPAEISPAEAPMSQNIEAAV